MGPRCHVSGFDLCLCPLSFALLIQGLQFQEWCLIAWALGVPGS